MSGRHRLAVPELPQAVTPEQLWAAFRALGVEDVTAVTRMEWDSHDSGQVRIGVRARVQVGAVGSYAEVTASLPVVRAIDVLDG